MGICFAHCKSSEGGELVGGGGGAGRDGAWKPPPGPVIAEADFHDGDKDDIKH